MRSNTKKVEARTHEGAPGVKSEPLQELRRAVMSCLLFEKQFYESGGAMVERMRALLKQVTLEEAAQLAIEAREKFKLRHVPLFIAREIIRLHKGRRVGDLIQKVIQRPDELGELLALYRKDGKGEPAQLKIGLARAMKKFSEYQLAKWNKDGEFKLRDVLFLSHPRPKSEEQKALFDKLAAKTLATPDTWEVALSEGADKKATFERLIKENKLGALALLRNLRGMLEAKVDEDLIRMALLSVNIERVLPFRFISAAKYAPQLEDVLEVAMFKCLSEQPKLPGKTALLIDHSSSMSHPVSAKSEVTRFDAAAALAMILRQTSDRCRVFTFSDRCIEVPPRKGFALLQAVKAVVNPVYTLLGSAVRHVYAEFPECERIIVITDEQSADRPPHPQGKGYIVNVAGNEIGIGYGPWVTINGWSEAILDYIRISETEESNA